MFGFTDIHCTFLPILSLFFLLAGGSHICQIHILGLFSARYSSTLIKSASSSGDEFFTFIFLLRGSIALPCLCISSRPMLASPFLAIVHSTKPLMLFRWSYHEFQALDSIVFITPWRFPFQLSFRVYKHPWYAWFGPSKFWFQYLDSFVQHVLILLCSIVLS